MVLNTVSQPSWTELELVNIISWKRQFKQRFSTVPTDNNKTTTTFHLKSLNTKIKRSWHMALEIQVLAWHEHKNETGLNRLVGSIPSPMSVIVWFTSRYMISPSFHRSNCHFVLHHWQDVLTSTSHNIVCWWLVIGSTVSSQNETHRHDIFQQYFNYIVAVSFIVWGNRSTRWTPPTFCILLTNFITSCCIEYTTPRMGFELTNGGRHWLHS